MDRKHFLKISTVSLAGLIFNAGAQGAEQEEHLLALPDEVWIRSGEEWHKLSSSNSYRYVYRDVEVLLKYSKNLLPVLVTSPTLSLSAVKLKWRHSISSNTLCLGDHWERTYGDVSWQKPSANKMPWYFIHYDKNSANCFGIKTGCNSIGYWNIDSAHMQLTLDTASGGVGVQLGPRTLHAADIITTKNKTGERLFTTAQRFCKLMCDKPMHPKQPVYGINDWYFTYGNNSAALILEHTSLLTELATNNDNRPFSVIDAGWAFYSPLLPGDCCWQDDSSRPNEHFKDMHKLAGDIHDLGMRPGLWMRPLCAAHDDKATLLLPPIPGRNNPNMPVLDPTIEENVNRIKHNISLYKEWGYQMVKHDYTTYDITGRWGFEMKESITTNGWRFNNNSKTTAEIILHLYKAIREASGSMYIIGCNTLSHLSAGLFELNRIGDDTSGKEWERTRKMGVNTLGFRMVQHHNFYEADGDCVGLTKQVPWDKNKQWMQLVAESSTPLFISAQPDAVGAEQKEFIKKSFATAATKLPVGEPLDWTENALPSKWRLNGQEVNFNWY